MISIILPIRNEFNFISRTLDSILNQIYPDGSFEIIISDGMSDDGTRKIIQKYQGEYSNIKLIDNPERFVPSGFNRALTQASGEVIIRMDGHSEIDANFVNNCINLLNETDADCVGGAIKHIANGMLGHVINIAQSSKFGVGGVAFRENILEGKYVDTLAFGAYRRKVFEKIGGYDEELIRNQDDEFNFRLIQNKGKIWLDPSIKSVYYPRNRLNKLFEQYFEYGLYKIRVRQKRRGFASWRHLVPGIFVFVSSISILISPISFLPFCLVVGSYLITNFLATILEVIGLVTQDGFKNNVQKMFGTLVFLPVTFLTLHLSYGAGFLIGLVKFWKKWNDIEVKDYNFDKILFMKNRIYKYKNIDENPIP